jgi:hypothetical protein
MVNPGNTCDKVIFLLILIWCRHNLLPVLNHTKRQGRQMKSSAKSNPNTLLGKLSPVSNPLKKKNTESLEQAFVDHLEFSLAKDRFSATAMDFYKSAALVVRDFLFERWIETQQTYYRRDARRVYYLSVEYMIGRMLGNAMLNLGLREPFGKALWDLGLDLESLQEMENDPGLGNGGLGRLAACFLDSMATMELPAYGYGIRYEFGIFSQKFQDGWQIEAPDHWLTHGHVWEIERPEFKYPVRFYGRCVPGIDEAGNYIVDWQNTEVVQAIAYDTPVPGYATIRSIICGSGRQNRARSSTCNILTTVTMAALCMNRSIQRSFPRSCTRVMISFWGVSCGLNRNILWLRQPCRISSGALKKPISLFPVFLKKLPCN